MTGHSCIEVNSVALIGPTIFADPAAPGEGVLVQVARGLYLTERAQVGGKVTRRIRRAREVVAQDPAAPGEGVLVQVARRPVSHRARAGRRQGYTPNPSCKGSCRPGPGGAGRGCPRPGRARPVSHRARAGRRQGYTPNPG